MADELPKGAPSGLRWAVWVLASASALAVSGYAANSAIEGKAKLAAEEASKPLQQEISDLKAEHTAANSDLKDVRVKVDTIASDVSSVKEQVSALNQWIRDQEQDSRYAGRRR